MGIVNNKKVNELLYYVDREKYFLEKAKELLYRAYISARKNKHNQEIIISLHLCVDFLERAYEMRKRADKCYGNK